MGKKPKHVPIRLDPPEIVPYIVGRVTVSRANVDADPLNIDVRTYIRIHSILERIEAGEQVTLREEIAALALIERLRPKDTTSNAIAGSSVRKYEGAFASAAKRKKNSGSPASDAEPDSDWFEAGGDGGNGSDDELDDERDTR